jgi:hypothetical protein
MALGLTGLVARTALANPPVAPTATITAPMPTVRPTAIQLNPPVTLSFDNVPNGTAVDAAYAPGATFSVVTSGPSGGFVNLPNHVYAVADPSVVQPPCTNVLACPNPGGNVVTLNAPNLVPWFEGASGAIKVTFNAPKPWVSVAMRGSGLPNTYINPSQITNEPYIQAYSAAGAFLTETLDPYPATDARWGTFTTVTVNAPAGQSIGFVILSTQQRSGPHVVAEFDNLTYPK